MEDILTLVALDGEDSKAGQGPTASASRTKD